jgi:hypothetical protein
MNKLTTKYYDPTRCQWKDYSTNTLIKDTAEILKLKKLYVSIDFGDHTGVTLSRHHSMNDGKHYIEIMLNNEYHFWERALHITFKVKLK